ncbi:hypothetical protein [Tropicibacter oceani]|uniref:Uncharacterized protein n=1 Tax=Tropicibacter oceani TaxID=3058420 RepID=A0ABY8QFT1_9RHOB|nr:hypothetical protein [Tropicibacter oceani]WGW02871.1 hypothetical protein QF118_13105 [Tropicibacter oceani]
MTDNQQKDMDARHKAKANEIITRMTENGASASEIAAQKAANKQSFGHEGEFDPEKH